MDERIINLMKERGHDDLCISVNEENLDERILDLMEKLVANEEAIRIGIGKSVVRNLKGMAQMGVYFHEAIHRQFTLFPVENNLVSWIDYLPPLSAQLHTLLEKYHE